MLSIGKIASGPLAARYYTDQVAQGREDYYSGEGEAPGRWVGSAAAAAGLGGRVDVGQLGHMLAGAGLRQAVREGAVAGFDLTFRAPKSVSVLWGVADAATARELGEAHDAAVAAALAYVEREACHAGFLYQAELRREVTERLGLAWGQVERGTADIEGVGRGVIAHFSQRRTEILRHMAAHGGRSAVSAQVAALETRRAKTELNGDRLREEWRTRAAEHGLDARGLAEVLRGVLACRYKWRASSAVQRPSGPWVRFPATTWV